MNEDLHALPELRWFWSITVFVGYREGVAFYLAAPCRCVDVPLGGAAGGYSGSQNRALRLSAIGRWYIYSRVLCFGLRAHTHRTGFASQLDC